MGLSYEYFILYIFSVSIFWFGFEMNSRFKFLNSVMNERKIVCHMGWKYVALTKTLFSYHKLKYISLTLLRIKKTLDNIH